MSGLVVLHALQIFHNFYVACNQALSIANPPHSQAIASFVTFKCFLSLVCHDVKPSQIQLMCFTITWHYGEQSYFSCRCSEFDPQQWYQINCVRSRSGTSLCLCTLSFTISFSQVLPSILLVEYVNIIVHAMEMCTEYLIKVPVMINYVLSYVFQGKNLGMITIITY